MALNIKADSGLPGLAEAMTYITTVVSLAFIITAFLISFIIVKIFNRISGNKRKNIWLILIGTLIGFSIPFFLHGVGDLTYSFLYWSLILFCGILGGILGYYLTPKKQKLKK